MNKFALEFIQNFIIYEVQIIIYYYWYIFIRNI